MDYRDGPLDSDYVEVPVCRVPIRPVLVGAFQPADVGNVQLALTTDALVTRNPNCIGEPYLSVLSTAVDSIGVREAPRFAASRLRVAREPASDGPRKSRTATSCRFHRSQAIFT